MPKSIPLNVANICTLSFLTHALHIANTLSSLLYHSCESCRKVLTSRLNALLKVRGRETKKAGTQCKKATLSIFWLSAGCMCWRRSWDTCIWGFKCQTWCSSVLDSCDACLHLRALEGLVVSAVWTLAAFSLTLRLVNAGAAQELFWPKVSFLWGMP